MAKYTVSGDKWVSPQLKEGTLQNLGDTVLEVCTEPVKNSGLKIGQNSMLSFNEEIYVRSVGGDTGVFTAVPFSVNGKGGGVPFSPWESGKDYDIGDYVVHSDYIYGCINKHTSSNTFEEDITNWEVLSKRYSYFSNYVGTWVDGSPIYEITIHTYTPVNRLVPEVIFDSTSLSIKDLVKFDAVVSDKNISYNVSSSYSENGRVGIEMWHVKGDGFKMIVNSDSLLGLDVFLTILYTKI